MIEEMKTKIYELVGTASMCWDETPHGVFDSTQAAKVAEQILSICKSEIAEAKIEENQRWEQLAKYDKIDCHPSFFTSRITELRLSPLEGEIK